MVLEGFLLFNSAEDADTFIKFLRKKRCKAHKKSIGVFMEAQEFHGPIDNVIGYLKLLAEDADIDEYDIDGKHPLDALVGVIERRKEALGRFLSSHEVGEVVFPGEEIKRLSETATLYMMQSSNPAFREKLAGPGQEKPLQEGRGEISEEEAKKARDLLAVFDLLEENGMIEEEGEHYRLTKKLPPADCVMKVNMAALPEIDSDDLPEHGLSSHVHLVASVQYEVFMDSHIYSQLSVDDIDEGLIGLDVEAESLESFYRDFERKGVIIGAILEVVAQAGRISFDTLCERLEDHEIQVEEDTGSVSLSLERDFLSSLVTEMRKEGYLTGSQENIRLGKG